ncbi:MAG: GGDEF domain-containing protein, partial [Acidobacteria bacterium]|nr:GGDEF domain-containing protein [Acidobacteriota bacterium]
TARYKLQVQAEVSSQLAMLDPLTGVGNRRFLDRFLATELPRARRNGYLLTVMMFDLNKFKQINDQYGHPAGDLVLTKFVERLKQALRSSDVVVRMGGDEFLAILPDCSPEQVPGMLSRLENLEVDHDGEKLSVTFAVGWTAYQPGEPTAKLLDRADQAVYENKRAGRAKEADAPRN